MLGPEWGWWVIAEMKDSDLMTVRELADYLRCHPSSIYNLLKKSKIPAFKVGSDWRFKRAAIDKWRLGNATWDQAALDDLKTVDGFALFHPLIDY
jgi:excisionase family DNA binding protein